MTDGGVPSILPVIVERLRAVFDPAVIYLYGSQAYGTPTSGSDIDLLVVVPDSRLSFYERAKVAYRALRGVGVPIDVQVYTRLEFDQRAALPVSFERTVASKGRVLYAA